MAYSVKKKDRVVLPFSFLQYCSGRKVNLSSTSVLTSVEGAGAALSQSTWI